MAYYIHTTDPDSDGMALFIPDEFLKKKSSDEFGFALPEDIHAGLFPIKNH